MTISNGHLVSHDPLVLPTLGTRQYRPSGMTAIPNLILAGDYLDGDWQVANMEAANYSGRRAANAILEASGSHEPPAMTKPPYRPPQWKPLLQIDEVRYKRGLPNLFDVDSLAPQLTQLLGI